MLHRLDCLLHLACVLFRLWQRGVLPVASVHFSRTINKRRPLIGTRIPRLETVAFWFFAVLRVLVINAEGDANTSLEVILQVQY